MVAIKLKRLLNCNNGNRLSTFEDSSCTYHDDDTDDGNIDDDTDLNEAQNDLAASIANRELLLTAAAATMKHNTLNNNNIIEMHMLRDEISMLRNEMRNRFDILEKKKVDTSTISSDTVSGIDISTVSQGIVESGVVLPSHVLLKVEELDSKKAAGDIAGMCNICGNINKQQQNKVLEKVKDDTPINRVHATRELLEEDTPIVISTDTMSDLVEEELQVNTFYNDKQHEERSVSPPTRVSKKNKKKNSKYKKKQTKGKHHQKNIKSKSNSIRTSIINPTGYHGKLTFFVTLINAIKTLLLMRGGKRLYMLLAFIAASYVFKEVDMSNCSSSSNIPTKESTSVGGRFDIGSRFSIGSFSFIQGVRALEDCPQQYIATDIDSYEIGSKVTIEEKVYECTESPCGWKIVGTCTGDMFLPSPEDSDLTTNPPTPLLVRVRTHSPMSFGTHSPAAAFPPGDNDSTSSTAASNCIDINIVYDDYPQETSWKLYKVNTAGDTEIESHTALEGDTSYSKSICLDDGEYKFVISDSYGGICCSDGEGHYTVTTSDGVVIAKGGEFEESESTLFSLPFIPYPSMSPSSSPRPTSSSNPTTSLSPTQGPKCEGSNPDVCGCVSVKQTDYRGSTNTTVSGKECIRWDETGNRPAEFPDADLEDNNYCRNLNGDYYVRAYCWTADGFEYCDVPICEDTLPSAYPTLSIHPTISARPTTSPSSSPTSPAPEPKCDGSNPEVCGCGSVDQADYRGTINTTVSGEECIRWDETWDTPEDYPDAGLEDNNYCRNPMWYDRAGCHVTTDGDEEGCDVPYCFPLASSCLSALDGNTNTSSISEELQAACAYHQCVVESEYELDDYIAPKRAEVKPVCSCLFEVWDCQFGTKGCERLTIEGEARKYDNECCASKLNDSNSTTQAVSCECLIKPSCDDGDSTKCNEFAEHCCDPNDQQCKCKYQTKACRLDLESDSIDLDKERSVCGSSSNLYGDGVGGWGAQVACCGENNNDRGLCTCDFWEPLCTDFPNAGVDTCSEASQSCCNGKHCYCDLFTHAVEVLGYEDNNEWDNCARESNVVPDHELEERDLQNIYNEAGGDYWYNNTGWTTESDHCNWFGITCNEEGYVIEFILPSNNVTGEFPAISLSSFYKLQRLVLDNNELHGMMAASNAEFAYSDDDYIPENWVTDTSLFFNLRDLTHVDLSQNNMNGEVDVLFAPALQYANFSHNNFTSINTFKKFKRSQQTLTVCDVSHNSINTSVNNLMKNVPPNIEQFIVSNNLIYSSFPATLEELANLRRFNMSMNSLSGELPDFSSVYPNLQALDLSDQDSSAGLVGNIPESLANLPFLSTLNLGGNKLSGSIPPVLGNMGQLRVLGLSSNKLSQTIPKELGKLGEFAHIICAFCRVMKLILLTCLYGHMPLADLELFDLSNNTLIGQIPSELDNLQTALIYLNGNSDM